MKILRWLVLCISISGLGACGGEPAQPDGGSDGGADACAPCESDAGEPDAGPPDTGDNNSFETADPISIGSTTVGVIDPPGDVDFYTFEGTAGEWVQILTQANAGDDPRKIDTVLTLYDASMRQIAESDDGFPRQSPDSELSTRLPADGRYYLQVQEYSTWAGRSGRGGPSFTYELLVLDFITSAPINYDEENGDDAASAQELATDALPGMTRAYILGTFDDESDVDVYSISLIAGGPVLFWVPSGTTGDGSTATPARMWITDASGSEIVARTTPAGGGILWAPGSGGDFLIFIESGGSVGANGFYVLKSGGFVETAPPETDDTANDDTTTPDTITFTEGAIRSGTLISHLGDGDVDNWAIDARTNERVTLMCQSAVEGSGVEGLRVELLDSTGSTTYADQTEVAPGGVNIRVLPVPAAGRYIVRLTKTGQDPEVTGDWVRCWAYLDMAP